MSGIEVLALQALHEADDAAGNACSQEAERSVLEHDLHLVREAPGQPAFGLPHRGLEARDRGKRRVRRLRPRLEHERASRRHAAWPRRARAPRRRRPPPPSRSTRARPSRPSRRPPLPRRRSRAARTRCARRRSPAAGARRVARRRRTRVAGDEQRAAGRSPPSSRTRPPGRRPRPPRRRRPESSRRTRPPTDRGAAGTGGRRRSGQVSAGEAGAGRHRPWNPESTADACPERSEPDFVLPARC